MKDVKLPPYTVVDVVPTLSQSQGWGIKQTGIPDTWSITQGEDITIMVIDTGCSDHPDLENIDRTASISCVDYEPEIDDEQGHSTHCAGIIGASNNDMGMVGVAPKCTIITVKALDSDGSGSFDAINKALDYAVKIKPDVVSMSLGSPTGNTKMHKLIKKLYDLNIPVICACGNDGRRNSVNFPARYEETISVLAYDKNGNPAQFNSTGEQADFSAPGVNIYSTYLNHGYAKLSGTCLSGNTLVYTITGPKFITDIQKGDIVFCLNEETNKIDIKPVEDVICNGNKKTYKMSTWHENIYATNNHPFLCVDKVQIGGGHIRKRYKYKLTWRKLQDLKKDDIIVTPLSLPESQNSVDEINNKLKEIHNTLSEHISTPSAPLKINRDFCQFIGAFLGDGFIYHDKRSYNKCAGVGLCIRHGYKQLDKQLPQKYNDIFHEAFNENVTRIQDGDLFKYSQYISNTLAMLGLDKNVYEKRIPGWCFTLPYEYKIALLSGLIDSDGWITSTGNLGFQLCNKLLIEDIKSFCHSFGLYFSNVYKKEIEKNNFCDRKTISFTINSTKIKDFYNDLNIQDKNYNKFIKSRKKTWKNKLHKTMSNDLKQYFKDFKLEKIKSIEEGLIEPVYDLTIQDNHNFIANGIIVHNSMAAPFISGIVGLLIAKHRKQEQETGQNDCTTVKQIKDHLIKYSDDKGIVGKDNEWGYGIINPVSLITECKETICKETIVDKKLDLKEKLIKLLKILLNLYSSR